MPSNQYGSSGVNVAQVREFVSGFKEREREATRASAKSFATGVITAAVVSYYTSRDRWKRP